LGTVGLVIAFAAHLEVVNPPSVVFEMLADMGELHRWNPNVRSSRQISGDRLTLGSRYESIIARGPLRITARSELVEVEPDRKVVYEGSIGWFWSIDWLTFEASGTGTRITFRNETRTPRLLTPLIPILNASFQRQAFRAVEGAAQYLADTSSDR
jgi:uncharacterized protein YndB with AHSA1/START domain